MNARLVMALGAWKAGADLRAGRSRSSWYRLRRELLAATGHDIAVQQPKSNVLQFRRIIYFSVAARPDWADELDAALKD